MEKRSTQIPSPKKLLYDRIAEQGTVSKLDLLQTFSLTKSTMTRILDEMTEESLLIESGFGESSGGRRPILYQINPSYGYIIGLEISRVYSSLGLFDMQMNPKSIVHWRMDQAFTPERFIDHISNQIRAFLRDHQLVDSQIIGIGIGAVGPLDREHGLILKPLHFLLRAGTIFRFANWWRNGRGSKLGWTTVPIPHCLGNDGLSVTQTFSICFMYMLEQDSAMR